eukprot:820549_1
MARLLSVSDYRRTVLLLFCFLSLSIWTTSSNTVETEHFYLVPNALPYNGDDSWSNGNEYCAATYGTTLATVCAESLQDELLAALSDFDSATQNGLYAFWIGLYADGTSWKWVQDDSELGDFEFWNPTHRASPRTPTDNLCVLWYPDLATARHTDWAGWADWSCGENTALVACNKATSLTCDGGSTVEEAQSECETITSFVWEDLVTSATGKPNAVHTLSIDEATLTLTINIEADYLGYSEADDNGEVYGTTYVIDFEDFNAHSDSITKPGTCQNRDGDDFEDPTWDEVWAFSETPNAGHVGGVDYLAYPRSNWWTVAMSSDDVCTVTYSASFTWAELMDCKSYDEKTPYITSTDNDDDITLQGTLYINVVSPFDYKEDYGYYRVYQLVSQPFEIVISKTVYVLGDVGINLLTMDIIAVYKEGEENTFRLIVLTESAEYLRLSREDEGTSYAYVFDALDTSNPITATNFATLETAETGTKCLGNKDYICTQMWQITASDVQCTTGGIFTDFSGTYSIQFNAVCRDVTDLGGDQELVDYCEGWLGEHEDEIITDDKVLLQADLTWKDEICDPEIFNVQFEAEMEFYYDSFGTELPDEGHLYQVGEDTVYVKISTEYPSDHYDVFETTLMNVWICTFDPLTDYDSIIAVSDVGAEAGGCFADEADNSDGKFDDHIYSLEYGGPQVDDFVLDVTTTALASNEIQFEFLVPGKVERDTLYIHAEIEVSLGSGRRRRVLLRRNGKNAMANQMEHFVGQIGLGSSPKPVPQSPVHHPKYPLEGPATPVQQPWVISLQSPWVMMIGGLLAVVLCVNIVVMGYTNCARPNRLRYSPVKGTDIDSEFDAASSERDAINVISE